MVGLSSELLLLHKVCNEILLDGYAAVHLREVTEADAGYPSREFVRAAIELRGQRPARPPGIWLGSVRELLETAGAHFPLVTLHRERTYPDSCWIGRLVDVDERRVTIEGIDTSARWDGLERYSLRSLTLVEFGGLYEEALTLVTRGGPRRRSR